MPNVIDLAGTVDEGEGSRLTATFYNHSGEPLEGASIIELTLSIQNESDGSTINNRADQNILNINGGTVAADGTLTLKMTGDDNPIVTRDGYEEPHILTIKWSWMDLQGVQQYGSQKWRVRVAPKKQAETLQRGWVG